MTAVTHAYAGLQQAEFDRDLIVRYDGHGPRYTSYPTADRFGPLQAAAWQQAVIARQPGSATKPLSLYFHLPFCDTICYYCACNKVITRRRDQAEPYLGYLERELALTADLIEQRPRAQQLHLGGGTPTFFSDAQLARLMAAVRRHFELDPAGEYAIEIDPRKVGVQTMAALAEMGFNRVSIGVQDFDPAVQRAVNRVQGEAETAAVIAASRANGFRSISLDLIYGLPLQTRETMARTLERVVALRPHRIALYNYAHLPERFPPQRRIDAQALPDATTKLDILADSIAALQAAGYVYIGMDHFALPDDDLALAQRRGHLHRNFQGYSTHADCDLLAFGVSAIGMVGGHYAQNARKLDDYYAALDAGQLPTVRGYAMSRDDLLRRAVIQALMCQFQLSFESFEPAYMIDFSVYFAEELQRLQPLAIDGLVVLRPDGIDVTPRGRLLVRTIAMVFDRFLIRQQPIVAYSRLI